MLKIYVSNNGDRQEVTVPPDTTIAQVFAKAGIAMGNAIPWLNDEPVGANQTLKELGVVGEAYLMAVSNKNNG